MGYKINGNVFGVRDLRILYSIKNVSKITHNIENDIGNKFDRKSIFYVSEKLRKLQKKGFVKRVGAKINPKTNRACNSYVVTVEGKQIINEWLKKK